jgi:uncharacterized membrane protein
MTIPVPPWHPMVVHFPLALAMTAGAALTAARVVRGDKLATTLATVGTWNLCLAAVAALAAIGSGLAAVIDLHVGPEARLSISAHVKSAMLLTVLLLFLGVWRGAGTDQTSRPSWIFVGLLWIAMGAALVTGYRGGRNVYEYGVGVPVGSRPL